MVMALIAALNVIVNQIYVLIGYISNNYTFPKPLSKQEEQEYLLKCSCGDEDARNTLIERNLRLVAHVAKKYQSSGKDVEDLIAIGTIGLIKAINSFNSEKCTKLATYAARCIENEILMVMRSEKKLQGEVSLYDPLGFDAEGNEVTLMDIIGSDEGDVLDKVELNTEAEKLNFALGNILTEREKKVIDLRYGIGGIETKNQREIAKEMGISRSYVSRIEKKALSKLIKYFEK